MEFTERMQRGRDAAAAKRHRGISTGKAAAGWNFKRRDPEKGTWDYAVTRAKFLLADTLSQSLEDYRRVMFPERYGFDDPELI